MGKSARRHPPLIDADGAESAERGKAARREAGASIKRVGEPDLAAASELPNKLCAPLVAQNLEGAVVA